MIYCNSIIHLSKVYIHDIPLNRVLYINAVSYFFCFSVLFADVNLSPPSGSYFHAFGILPSATAPTASISPAVPFELCIRVPLIDFVIASIT